MSSGASPEIRTPEAFQSAFLLAKDFDNTVAQTFEASPSGIGVHEACAITVDSMFGAYALDNYIKSGGLQNRAPIEIVRGLAIGAEDEELSQLTDQFIATKLEVLMGEIGTRFPDGSVWPRPTSGYLELREKVEEARSDGRLIDDLILSLGHEPFIRKTYQTWGVGEPTHIIAEEAITGLASEYPAEQLVKPSPVLMAVAFSAWKQRYGLTHRTLSQNELSRVVYVGDDPIKDGRMATESDVDFLLIDPSKSSETWQMVASRLQIGRILVEGTQKDV